MSLRSRFLRKRVLLPLAALVAAVFLAPLLIPENLVRDIVVRRLETALGRPVSVRDVRASLLPRPRVELTGLAISEAPDVALAALELDELDLSLAVGPLLRREIAIVSVTLVRPRVVLRAVPAADDGGGPPASAPPATGAAMRIEVRELAIRDGALRLLRADGVPLLEIAGLDEDLAATLTPAGDLTLAGETRLDTLRLHLPQGVLGEGMTVRWRKDLRYEAGARRLSVAASTLELGDLPVALSGQVDSLGSARPWADLELSGGPVQVASLLGFLPPSLFPRLAGMSSGGTVALGGHVRGPLGAPDASGAPPFAYDVRFDLSEGHLADAALPAPVGGIELHVRARDGSLDLERFAAATARSRLDVSGTASDLLTAPTIQLKVDADLDLAEVTALQVATADAVSLSGRLAGIFTVRGPVADPAALDIAGAGRLTGAAVSGPDLQPPLTDVAGPVRLRDGALELEGVFVRQGGSDLTLTGTVRNYLALTPEPLAPPPADLQLRVTGARFDADQYAARKPAGQAAAGAAGASAAGDAAGGLAKLALLTGSLDVSLDRLLTRGQELDHVRGVVRLDRGRLLFDGVTAGLYGGTADLGGSVDLRDPARGTLDLSVRMRDVQAAQLSTRAVAMSRFARLGGLVRGTVDGTATLRGALDDTFGLDLATLTSAGEISLHQAQLSGLPVQQKLADLLSAPQLAAVSVADWLQPFRIEDGKLHVDGLQLTAAGVGVRAAGWQALDGTLALGLQLTVPQSLAQGLRRLLPEPAAALLLDGSATPLVVPVGVSGRFDDPRVQVDTGALTSAAADRARSRVTQEKDAAQRRLLDEAAGRLRGLVGTAAGHGDTASAATDSAGADSSLALPAPGEAPLPDQVKSLLKKLGGKR